MKKAKVDSKVNKQHYRRPEVHDLGKLEQVQGAVGTNDELRGGRYFLRRIF
jgi:hypothetical protein